MKILVTGGAGYIGSHTVVELLQAGHDPVIVDNLSNSHPEAIDHIEHICGKRPAFHQVDLCDKAALTTVFEQEDIDAVIHFAALKAVGESVEQPLRYYTNNLVSTFNLLECMQQHKIYQLIFSSSAAVYGPPKKLPIPETAALQPINPYGRTKAMAEQILGDLAASNPAWRITSLRYFNPVGAHESGEIGEDPMGPPENLVPFVAQVASGRRPQLQIFGDDYDTPDGTGVRDYVHVMDIAAGHTAALTHLPKSGHAIYNLGTGHGNSVLEVITAFESASGKTIPHSVAPR
ncbi:MAG TPA: UDP-glucose 4-epimerase GalE, partial [Candidatus Saccharimonadales bacterium]|nr:UDP-glucose 4-epimerase GalE [Candidatus Saccharimonadales bacterium]